MRFCSCCCWSFSEIRLDWQKKCMIQSFQYFRIEEDNMHPKQRFPLLVGSVLVGEPMSEKGRCKHNCKGYSKLCKYLRCPWGALIKEILANNVQKYGNVGKQYPHSPTWKGHNWEFQVHMHSSPPSLQCMKAGSSVEARNLQRSLQCHYMKTR